jgi:predicted ATP-binding protein involved in virulence
MRIDQLFLPSFKNLKSFKVDFDETKSKQVIVGQNGTGKSNLLEAISTIFRDLDLKQMPGEDADVPGFEYEIDYSCNGHDIAIQCFALTVTDENREGKKGSSKSTKRNGFERRIFVRSNKSEKSELIPNQAEIFPVEKASARLSLRDAENEVTSAAFYRLNDELRTRILPRYVFGYYSGVSSRFDKLFAKHEEIYYRAQIDGEEQALRRLFQAKPLLHSQFALLAFLARQDEQAVTFLREEFGIEDIVSVLFALRQPYWSKSRKTKGLGAAGNGDARFWGVRGKVKPFLASLYENALAPISRSEKIFIARGREESFERRYLYLTGDAIKAVAKNVESPKEFFARLESAAFSSVLSEAGDDLMIQVKLLGNRGNISFQELSEGQRQLLTVIGLMRFTGEDESLFLLDEPDTHLNPAWAVNYLANLQKYGIEPPNSQVLMTTHSPLVFAGLLKEEVVILEQDKKGNVKSTHPTSHPRGMGFAAILTSRFFGLRSSLYPKTTLRSSLNKARATSWNL